MALLPSLRCPHCGQRATRWWAATSSAPAQPARCRECGGLSHLSLVAYLLMMVGVHVFFLLGIVAPFALQSAWGLVFLPIGLGAAMLLGACFPLRATWPAAVERAERRARRTLAWAIGLGAVLAGWALLRSHWPG